MKKIIVLVIALLGIAFLRSLGMFYPLREILPYVQLAILLYLAVVIFQFIRDNSKRKPVDTNPSHPLANPFAAAPLEPDKSSGGGAWLGGIVVCSLVIFFMREALGRISFSAFLFGDNLVKFSPSLSPALAWAFAGLFIGAVYGSFVAWKKYKLPAVINLIPVAAALLIFALLFLINEPLANSSVVERSSQDTEVDTLSTPSQLIRQKWELVDVKGKSNKNFFQRDKGTSLGFEFKDNGKCYKLENDVTVGILTYVMAADEQSFELISSNKKSLRFQIISLTKNEMVLSSRVASNETARFRSQNN